MQLPGQAEANAAACHEALVEHPVSGAALMQLLVESFQTDRTLTHTIHNYPRSTIVHNPSVLPASTT